MTGKMKLFRESLKLDSKIIVRDVMSSPVRHVKANDNAFVAVSHMRHWTDDSTIVFSNNRATDRYVKLQDLQRCKRSANVMDVSRKIEVRHRVSIWSRAIELPKILQENYEHGEEFVFCYDNDSRLMGIVTVADLSDYAFLLSMYALIARAEDLTRRLVTTYDKWWLILEKKLPSKSLLEFRL